MLDVGNVYHFSYALRLIREEEECISNSFIIVREQYIQKNLSVAVLVIGYCVVYRWKEDDAGIQKSHGYILAYVTGSCNSRWRPRWPPKD